MRRILLIMVLGASACWAQAAAEYAGALSGSTVASSGAGRAFGRASAALSGKAAQGLSTPQSASTASPKAVTVPRSRRRTPAKAVTAKAATKSSACDQQAKDEKGRPAGNVTICF